MRPALEHIRVVSPFEACCAVWGHARSAGDCIASLEGSKDEEVPAPHARVPLSLLRNLGMYTLDKQLAVPHHIKYVHGQPTTTSQYASRALPSWAWQSMQVTSGFE